MRKKLTSTLLLSSIIFLLSSCLGDKGNELQSYDVGTIVNYNGQPTIKTDNIAISLTGSGLTLPNKDLIERCLFTFTLDWDNQPEGAYASGVYSADIVFQERWNASKFETIANKPFAGSDSLNNISEPYLTVLGDTTLLTFQSSIEKGEDSSTQFVQGSVNEATNTVVIDYIYYTGNAQTITTTEKKWQSYILPKFERDYTLVFRFKSLTKPSFKTEDFKDPAGDKNKNCYLYTLQYKATNK